MKNIYRIFTSIIIIGFSFLFVSAQKADNIIAKHVKAHGGADNWAAVKSIKITGIYSAFSVEKEFTTIKSRPNKYHSDFYMNNTRRNEGYNGANAWVYSQRNQQSLPRRTSSAEENVILQKAEFCTPFFNYKEKGYIVKYLGKEAYDGVELLKLKLIKADKDEETWYLDPKTYLEYVSISSWSDNGRPVQQESFYSEFTKVDNIILPFYIETAFSTRNREIRIEKVELNIKPDNSIFDLPLSDQMKKLTVLEGEWDVKVERSRRGKMSPLPATTSSIKFVDDTHLLQEKITYIPYMPLTVILNWTYNTDTKSYRVSTFNDYSSQLDIYEGNFENDTLKLDDVNISFGETKKENQEFGRLIIRDIKPDSFITEISQSRDKGITWNIIRRFTYSRKK